MVRRHVGTGNGRSSHLESRQKNDVTQPRNGTVRTLTVGEMHDDRRVGRTMFSNPVGEQFASPGQGLASWGIAQEALFWPI